MAFKKIPLTIDTMIRNPVPIEGINQEDNIELNIVVTENKTPKDLSRQTIKVYVRRIDGTLVEQTDQITPTNASKGEVTVKLKNSAFNKEGYALFQLDISDSSGRITSSYATFKIGKGLVSGEAIANTNEIEALKKVEEYIKKANQELETFKQTVTEINENEATRQENEVVRVREEASRNKAEAIRVQQEATRKEKENERVQAEIQRIADEEVRRENEALRGSKELERKQAEELRKEKELLRIADEKNRKVAESKRIEAESVRVEAEKLRVAAETGRVEAESLRVTAEEERVAAETKREEGFNKFDGKINANTKELKAARTATTGEKFDTLDERIDHEVDRLNKKIDVTMLQQEEAESHTILNTVDGMTTDMVIKGRTLENLFTTSVNNLALSDVSLDGNTFIVNPVNDRYPSMYDKNSKYKENTNYTVILDILENTLQSTSTSMALFFGNAPTESVLGSTLYKFDVSNGKNGRFIQNVKTIPDFSILTRNLGFKMYMNNNYTGGKLKFNIMVIETSMLGTKQIPSYFSGIKSFGESEQEGDKYKISILSSGKNLFNDSLLIGKDIELIESEYPIFKQSIKLSEGNYCSQIEFTDGTKVMDANFILTGYDKKNTLVRSFVANNIRNLSAEQANEIVYLRLVWNEQGINSYRNKVIKNISLIKSDTIVNGEPYKEDKKDILLPFSDGLKSVGNVCDELVSNTKKAIERIQKDVFVGNEDWVIRDDIRLADVTVFRLNSATRNQYKTDGFLICNKFNRYANQYQNYEGIRLVGAEAYGVTIGISKSKLTTDDSMGFKNLLKKWNSEGNPLILYSEMTTPVEHDLPSDLEVNTYQDKTYVEFQNSISGTSSFKSPVNAAATISSLNRENRALEEENRSLRQDFESTTLSLTDSDLELVKQNVDMDFRLMEVEFALDIPQSTLSSNIKFKKKGEVKSMARTPYEMMKIVILSGDYDREDYIHKVGKYYERGRMTKEEYDELMSLMTADEVIGE